MKCDELQRHSIRGVMFNGEEICGGFAYYDSDEVDEAIAELKDKIQQKDFFWEGCGFAKMGFKNTIAVYEYLDNLNAEKRKLKRALWLARAISAINAVGAIHNVIVCMQERNPKMSLSNIEAQKQVWKNVARKCRAMAEKFK